MKCLKCWRLYGSLVSFQRVLWYSSPEFPFGNQTSSFVALWPRKISLFNWCLSNYRTLKQKFALQLMAAIIKVNNVDDVVEEAKNWKGSAYFTACLTGRRSEIREGPHLCEETVFLSNSNCGKSSGTKLLTNKVSTGKGVINHLPKMHKASERQDSPEDPGVSGRDMSSSCYTDRPLGHFWHLAPICRTCPLLIDLIVTRHSCHLLVVLSLFDLTENLCRDCKQ